MFVDRNKVEQGSHVSVSNKAVKSTAPLPLGQNHSKINISGRNVVTLGECRAIPWMDFGLYN